MARPKQRSAAFKESYVEADGFSIRFWESAPKSRQASPVVTLDTMTWGLSELHYGLARKYRVFAFELPGFGGSPANTKSSSMKGLAATLDQAISKVVTDKYVLLGTSLGANVALWQALQEPDKVEVLVLISPTAILPSGEPMPGTPEELAQRLPPVDPAILAKEQVLTQRLKGTTHDIEAESRLGDLQCATLVVFGHKDSMVAPEAARLYRQKIPNSNVSFVYDAGHFIVADRPEALINAVSDYVERRETFTVSRQSSIISP